MKKERKKSIEREKIVIREKEYKERERMREKRERPPYLSLRLDVRLPVNAVPDDGLLLQLLLHLELEPLLDELGPVVLHRQGILLLLLLLYVGVGLVLHLGAAVVRRKLMMLLLLQVVGVRGGKRGRVVHWVAARWE
jgi:hypothetical protein